MGEKKTPWASAFHSSHKAKSVGIFRSLEAVLPHPYLIYRHQGEAGNSLGPWNSVKPYASMGIGFSILGTMQDSTALTSQPCGDLSKEGTMGTAETKSQGSEPKTNSEMENKAATCTFHRCTLVYLKPQRCSEKKQQRDGAQIPLCWERLLGSLSIPSQCIYLSLELLAQFLKTNHPFNSSLPKKMEPLVTRKPFYG